LALAIVRESRRLAASQFAGGSALVVRPRMKIALIIIACLVGITFVVLLVRSRIAPTYPVTARDIPAIISQLERSGKDGHFVVLMFVPRGSTDGESVNLQYSIDGGVVGLDWVLLGPRNIADRAKVGEFAAKLGHQLNERELNGVHYLRVTGSGISKLGAKIIQDCYQISPDAKLGVITEGFKWQP
jgi:hypothetical protein